MEGPDSVRDGRASIAPIGTVIVDALDADLAYVHVRK